jgi:hypothetical protein
MAAICRQGKNAVLKLGLMPNTKQATQMMTRLLVQHVKRTLTIAETGTLVRRPLSLTYSWHTPLNSQRIEHFCTHLHNLILDPLTAYSELSRTQPRCSSFSSIWRHRYRHSSGGGRKIVCLDLISSVFTLVGGA